MKLLWSLLILLPLTIGRPNEKNDYVKVNVDDQPGDIKVAAPANELVEALEGETHTQLSNRNKWELVKCLLGISVMENTKSAMEKEAKCVLAAFRQSVTKNLNAVEKTRKVRQIDRLLEPLQTNQFLDVQRIKEHPLMPVQNWNAIIAQFFSTDQNNTAIESPNVAPLMSGDGETRK